jgi:patatin-related protein
VRATAPEMPPNDAGYSDRLLLADEKLVATEPVYRRLGQFLSWDGDIGTPGDASSPVTTRFVVDILSGTSAGGINGIFLAKALANELGIDQLRALWFNEGDMTKLLYDEKSYEGVQLTKVERPPSLLNSRRMYWELLSALRGMSTQVEDSTRRSRLVDELDLWITATDIYGLAVPIDLWDRTVYEKRHKNVFRFSYANPFASDDDAPLRNDFVADLDPLLAFAARCTSAIPFAFEPMELADVDGVMEANPDWAAEYGTEPSKNAAWSRFFKDYIPARDKENRWYAKQSFGDGGYLDNKPFTWATGALMRRRADLPVDRKLIYVEPDPGTDHMLVKTADAPLPRAKTPSERDVRPKPDALANAKAAALELPRAEPIRDDLEALLTRNRNLARLDRITKALDVPAADKWRISADDWTTKAPTEHHPDFHYAAYNRLKIATVLDDLAEVVTIVAGFDPDSDERTAIRCFVQAWYRKSNRNTGPAQAQFLLDFDLPYRFRRLQFLQDRIDELLRGDPAPLEMIGTGESAAPATGELKDELLKVKRELNGVLVALRDVRRSLRLRSAENPIFGKVGNIHIGHSELMQVLALARTPAESDERAYQKLSGDGALYAAVDSVASQIGNQLSAVFKADENDVRNILAGHETGATEATRLPLQALVRFYDTYEAFDSITLPIAYGSVGESDRVEVIRVSPEDATCIVDELADGCRKLGGIHYGHFGGFLNRTWRENDFMWGRLDAADRLLTALLPAGTVQDELKEQAFHAILREERPMRIPRRTLPGSRSNASSASTRRTRRSSRSSSVAKRPSGSSSARRRSPTRFSSA